MRANEADRKQRGNGQKGKDGNAASSSLRLSHYNTDSSLVTACSLSGTARSQ